MQTVDYIISKQRSSAENELHYAQSTTLVYHNLPHQCHTSLPHRSTTLSAPLTQQAWCTAVLPDSRYHRMRRSLAASTPETANTRHRHMISLQLKTLCQHQPHYPESTCLARQPLFVEITALEFQLLVNHFYSGAWVHTHHTPSSKYWPALPSVSAAARSTTASPCSLCCDASTENRLLSVSF